MTAHDAGSRTRRPRVVVTNWIHDDVLRDLQKYCEVTANQSPTPLSNEAVQAQARDADGVLVFMPDRVDAGFLAACPRLRVIAAALKGYDNFDVEACTARGVWFSIVPDLLTEPTAELAVGSLIALTRNILSGDRYVRSGRFDGWRPILYGQGLAGARVAILGMGRVGQAIARRLQPFGCSLAFWDQESLDQDTLRQLGGRAVNLQDALAQSDIVIVALSLNCDTLHLIDADALALMSPGGYLLNAARGSIVDEAAVADALEQGRLAGYAADVFEMEDWARPSRPRSIEARLRDMPDRTVLTPHLGSAVDDVRRNIARRAADNLLDVLLRGQPPRDAVNHPLGKHAC